MIGEYKGAAVGCTATVFLYCSVTLILLTGCSLPPWITQTSEEISDQIESTIEQTRDDVKDKPSESLTRQSSKSWLGLRKPTRVRTATRAIPQSLHRNIEITFTEPVTLRDISQLIASETGVPVVVRADVPSTFVASINWSGTASQALDQFTGKYEYQWQFINDRVEIFYTDLASWTIFGPTTTSQWQGSVGLSGSVTSDSGGSDVQANDQVVISMDTTDFWSQIENTVASMLSPAGRFTLNRYTGELTVVDTPRIFDRIDSWVSAKTRSLLHKL